MKLLLNDLKDIISSISVLLIFLALLFEYLRQSYRKVLHSSFRLNEHEKAKKDIKWMLWTAAGVSIVFLFSTYLLLPTSIKIINSSSLELWNFEIFPTIFIVIHLGITFFFGYSLYGIIKLFNKLKKLK